MWQSFLPFGLSVAICIFVSWKAAENQLELRESGSGRGGEGDDDEATAPAPRPGSHPKHRPPRTASEIRARLHTLSRLPPGPRRLARGRALALASERALREVSPPEEVGDGDGDGGRGRHGARALMRDGQIKIKTPKNFVHLFCLLCYFFLLRNDSFWA